MKEGGGRLYGYAILDDPRMTDTSFEKRPQLSRKLLSHYRSLVIQVHSDEAYFSERVEQRKNKTDSAQPIAYVSSVTSDNKPLKNDEKSTWDAKQAETITDERLLIIEHAIRLLKLIYLCAGPMRLPVDAENYFQKFHAFVKTTHLDSKHMDAKDSNHSQRISKDFKQLALTTCDLTADELTFLMQYYRQQVNNKYPSGQINHSCEEKNSSLPKRTSSPLANGVSFIAANEHKANYLFGPANSIRLLRGRIWNMAHMLLPIFSHHKMPQSNDNIGAFFSVFIYMIRLVYNTCGQITDVIWLPLSSDISKYRVFSIRFFSRLKNLANDGLWCITNLLKWLSMLSTKIITLAFCADLAIVLIEYFNAHIQHWRTVNQLLQKIENNSETPSATDRNASQSKFSGKNIPVSPITQLTRKGQNGEDSKLTTQSVMKARRAIQKRLAILKRNWNKRKKQLYYDVIVSIVSLICNLVAFFGGMIGNIVGILIMTMVSVVDTEGHYQLISAMSVAAKIAFTIAVVLIIAGMLPFANVLWPAVIVVHPFVHFNTNLLLQGLGLTLMTATLFFDKLVTFFSIRDAAVTKKHQLFYRQVFQQDFGVEHKAHTHISSQCTTSNTPLYHRAQKNHPIPSDTGQRRNDNDQCKRQTMPQPTRLPRSTCSH